MNSSPAPLEWEADNGRKWALKMGGAHFYAEAAPSVMALCSVCNIALREALGSGAAN